MECIKLSSYSDVCKSIAKVLIDSPVIINNSEHFEGFTLLYVGKDRFVTHGKVAGCSRYHETTEILIPIQTMCLDEFAAIREHLQLKIVPTANTPAKLGTKVNFSSQDDIIAYFEDYRWHLSESQQLFLDVERLPDSIVVSDVVVLCEL